MKNTKFGYLSFFVLFALGSCAIEVNVQPSSEVPSASNGSYERGNGFSTQ